MTGEPCSGCYVFFHDVIELMVHLCIDCRLDGIEPDRRDYIRYVVLRREGLSKEQAAAEVRRVLADKDTAAA